VRFKAKQGMICLKGTSGRIYCFRDSEPTAVVDGRDIKAFIKAGELVSLDSKLEVTKAEVAAPVPKVTKVAEPKPEPPVVKKEEPKPKVEEVKEEKPEPAPEPEKEEEEPTEEDEDEEDKPGEEAPISTRRAKKRGRR